MRALCYILLMIPFGLCGQSKPQIAVHFDRPFYMVGETVHFSIWAINTQWPPHVQRVEVISPNNQIKEAFFVRIDSSGHGTGHFNVANSWAQGVYLFRISTFDQSVDEYLELINHPLFIYSDFIKQEPDSLKWTNSMSNRSGLTDSSGTGRLLLECEDEVAIGGTYRLKIRIAEAEEKTRKTDVSIAVRDRQIAGSEVVGRGSILTSEVEEIIDPSRFMIYQLSVVDSVNSADEERELIGFDQSQFVSYGLESTNRLYEFSLVPRIGEYVYQFFWEDLVPVQNVSLNSGFYPSDPIRLPINQRVIESIEAKKLRRKISRWFEIEESRDHSTASANVLPQPSSSFDLDEFDEFESVEQFLREISTPLKVRRSKKAGLELKLVNPDDKPYFEGAPVFIMDGIIQSDPGKLLELDIGDITKIDFYNRRLDLRSFDTIGEYGVVAVTTNREIRESPAPNSLTLQGLVGHMEYPVKRKNGDSELPYFSPLIYWNPDISIDAGGEVEVHFSHSDDVGKFEIEVFAIDTQGNFDFGYCNYQAKKKD